MKILRLSLLALPLLAATAGADLTIVQNIDGAAAMRDMTIKVKGDKARIEAGAKMTTLMDGASGDIINLMNDQKRFIRISGDKVKAMANMAAQFGAARPSNEKPKLTPTGKSETISGYQADEYSFETPQLKASYWIAKNYPDAANIVKQLQALKPQSIGPAASGIPDYRDLPGVPLRTRITMGDHEIVTTISSIKEDPLPDAEFSVPADFQEVKLPDIHLHGSKAPKTSETPAAQPTPQP